MKIENLAGGTILAAAPLPVPGEAELDPGRRQRAWTQAIVATTLGLVLTACATATPGRQGQLSSYEGVSKGPSFRTRAYLRADRATLKAARTFEIEPVRFADGVGGHQQLPARTGGERRESSALRRLEPKARSACPGRDAGPAVRATITGFNPTGRTMAGASFVLSHLSPVPMTPRIPFGLGSLSAEGEVVDGAGRQVAALIWERGADAFTTSPKVSTIGDAYQLSLIFGRDMGELVVTGENPIRDVSLPRLPHRRKPASSCAVFGKGPGLTGFVTSRFAAAPEWLDRSDRVPPAEDRPSLPADHPH